MPLTRVTITGADDKTDLRELSLLSLDFPFVEWGILRSQERACRPRYPGLGWIEKAEDTSFVQERLALHLCGQDARDTAAGKTSWLRDPAKWKRVQLNGLDGAVSFSFSKMTTFTPLHGVQWIFQMPSADSLVWCRHLNETAPRVSFLFDGSGGRGIQPDAWPNTARRFHLGYAGGIRPDTVAEVLTSIGHGHVGARDFWIDMESGVRDSNDQFDLTLVRRALEAAEPFVMPGVNST